jgi:hypothetical protein
MSGSGSRVEAFPSAVLVPEEDGLVWQVRRPRVDALVGLRSAGGPLPSLSAIWASASNYRSPSASRLWGDRHCGDVTLGAFGYLVKPANADDIVAALITGRLESRAGHEAPTMADWARWEHIQRIFKWCRPKRVGNRAPAQHAPPHAPAHFTRAVAKVRGKRGAMVGRAGLEPATRPL